MLQDERTLPSVQPGELDGKKQQAKKALVDWLFEIGEKFKQSNLTIHIAIAYLERAFSLSFDRIGGAGGTPRSEP